MLAPVMEEVSEEFGDSVSFYNIDVDENMDIAQMYKIVSIPTLILLKKGEKSGYADRIPAERRSRFIYKVTFRIKRSSGIKEL